MLLSKNECICACKCAFKLGLFEFLWASFLIKLFFLMDLKFYDRFLVIFIQKY